MQTPQIQFLKNVDWYVLPNYEQTPCWNRLNMLEKAKHAINNICAFIYIYIERDMVCATECKI